MRLKLKWVNHHRNWDFLPSQNEIWVLNKILSLWNDFPKLYFRRDTRVCVYLYSIQMKRILTEAICKILAYTFFEMFLFDPHPPWKHKSIKSYFMGGWKGSIKKKWVKKILENFNALSSFFSIKLLCKVTFKGLRLGFCPAFLQITLWKCC